MVKQCYVCKKFRYLNKDLSFHIFPSDISIRKQWFNLLGFEEDRKLPKTAAICSLHFRETDFDKKPSGVTYLKRGALPLPTSQDDEEETPPKRIPKAVRTYSNAKKKLRPTATNAICSMHFKEEDLDQTPSFCAKLLETTAPTINLQQVNENQEDNDETEETTETDYEMESEVESKSFEEIGPITFTSETEITLDPLNKMEPIEILRSSDTKNTIEIVENDSLKLLILPELMPIVESTVFEAEDPIAIEPQKSVLKVSRSTSISPERDAKNVQIIPTLHILRCTKRKLDKKLSDLQKVQQRYLKRLQVLKNVIAVLKEKKAQDLKLSKSVNRHIKIDNRKLIKIDDNVSAVLYL